MPNGSAFSYLILSWIKCNELFSLIKVVFHSYLNSLFFGARRIKTMNHKQLVINDFGSFVFIIIFNSIVQLLLTLYIYIYISSMTKFLKYYYFQYAFTKFFSALFVLTILIHSFIIYSAKNKSKIVVISCRCIQWTYLFRVSIMEELSVMLVSCSFR